MSKEENNFTRGSGMVESYHLLSDKNYIEFLNEIKCEIKKARIKAIHNANKQLIVLYWNIGRRIIERQKQFGWGKSVVERLANDLEKEYGNTRGFSARNLWDMRRFYEEYKNDTFLRQAVAEIPWGHNLLILNKVPDRDARKYYITSSAKMGWTRNVLFNQIKANAYQRHIKMPKKHNFPKVLPVYLAEQADETMKNVYNLDFLGITKPIQEKELEKRLIERIKNFILELGYGFSFIGNQYRLMLGDNEYFIDLLFFNRYLKCLVVIELKVGKFEPEYAGKMDFYLHLVDEQLKLKEENPSIGIILCAEKDNIVVEYALKSVKKPIGVAEYTFTHRLPKRLQGKLPGPEAFKRSIKAELV